MADRARYGFLLLGFAFMPDHVHLVIVPADGYSVSKTMRVIKGGIARRVNELRGMNGPMWQEGFFDRVAKDIQQLNAFVAYTHENAVRAGIVSAAEEYPYSSADGRCRADYERFVDEEHP